MYFSSCNPKLSRLPKKDRDEMERWAPSVHPETSPMINTLEWEGMYTSLVWEKDVFAICVYVVSTGWPRGLEVAFHL